MIDLPICDGIMWLSPYEYQRSSVTHSVKKKKSQRPNGIWADNRQLNNTPYFGHSCVSLRNNRHSWQFQRISLFHSAGFILLLFSLCQFCSGTCCYLLPSNIYTGVALYVSRIGIVIKVDLGCWLAARHPYILHLYSRHIRITKYPLHFAQLCRSVLLYLRYIYTVLYLCDNDSA